MDDSRISENIRRRATRSELSLGDVLMGDETALYKLVKDVSRGQCYKKLNPKGQPVRAAVKPSFAAEKINIGDEYRMDQIETIREGSEHKERTHETAGCEPKIDTAQGG